MIEEFIGYCVKCHTQRVVHRTGTAIARKTGRHVLMGNCPECQEPIRRVLEGLDRGRC